MLSSGVDGILNEMTSYGSHLKNAPAIQGTSNTKARKGSVISIREKEILEFVVRFLNTLLIH